MYYLDRNAIDIEALNLLEIDDETLTLATLDYLLAHAENNEDIVFDHYLDNNRKYIANAALVCLAKEARTNKVLGEKYQLASRLEQKSKDWLTLSEPMKSKVLASLVEAVGLADYKNGYVYVFEGLKSDNEQLVKVAIQAAANTMSFDFLDVLLNFLPNKTYRPEVIHALKSYGVGLLSVLCNKMLDVATPLAVSRLLPRVLMNYSSEDATKALFSILTQAEDLTVRLECIRALTSLKWDNPSLNFNKKLLANIILEECKLYNNTLNAMHTQVIIHFLKRKKQKSQISQQEMDARESLMELLENRLDAGLERIFKLLELKYSQADVQVAYQGILSDEQEKRTHAIEFLDNLLNPTLRMALIPIIESTVLDTSSEEVIETISKNKLTEFTCFQIILKHKDLKLKLAVLYLIEQQRDPKYMPLLDDQLLSKNLKIQTFAQKAKEALQNN